MIPKAFILDVDGVMTTGQFFYTEEGKVMKVFGADDNDALSLLKQHIKNIIFVTGDKKGYKITQKRIVEDMGYPLFLVSTIDRIKWIKDFFDPKEVIYMGDGIFDHYVFREVGYSIAPSHSDPNAWKYANFVTKRTGGNRAVAEACLHIMEKFFEPYNPEELPNSKLKYSGEWLYDAQ